MDIVRLLACYGSIKSSYWKEDFIEPYFFVISGFFSNSFATFTFQTFEVKLSILLRQDQLDALEKLTREIMADRGEKIAA